MSSCLCKWLPIWWICLRYDGLKRGSPKSINCLKGGDDDNDDDCGGGDDDDDDDDDGDDGDDDGHGNDELNMYVCA